MAGVKKAEANWIASVRFGKASSRIPTADKAMACLHLILCKKLVDIDTHQSHWLSALANLLHMFHLSWWPEKTRFAANFVPAL